MSLINAVVNVWFHFILFLFPVTFLNREMQNNSNKSVKMSITSCVTS